MRHSPNPNRSGFTLVELLVVISIITVLAALLVPAVFFAISKAKESKIGIELANIEDSLERYKLEFGEYPPDFAELAEYTTDTEKAAAAMGIITDHLARNFRRRDISISPPTGDWPRNSSGNITAPSVLVLAQLNPTNALAFWLRGFSPDPTHPIFGAGTRESFFGFDESRLDLSTPHYTSGTDNTQIAINVPYYPAGGLDNRPYIYFRANYNTTISTQPTANSELTTALAGPPNNLPPSASEPYRGYVNAALWAYQANDNGWFTYPVPSPYFSYSGLPTEVDIDNPLSGIRGTVGTLYPYAAAKKYQLISAGLDGIFGVGGDWGSGIGNSRSHQYNVADKNNLTSFSGGKVLEDLKEE